jgi:SSS family solute:Na+ symporter
MTLFWGLFCIGFALYANQLGSLIVMVNKVGSLFYGTMLAVFLIAFYVKHVTGPSMFWAALISQTTVFICAATLSIAWLWWNVIGCVTGVVAALLIEKGRTLRPAPTDVAAPAP